MIDVCEAMRDALTSAGFSGVSLRRLDEMTGKEGIVIRQVTPMVSRRYADRSWTTDVVVGAYCRYRSEHEAMTVCSAVRDVLDWLALPSPSGGYAWTATEVYTEPAELAFDEAGMYTYLVQFKVTIERK